MEEIILAIRLRQLGDILATLGALKALKRGAPARRILFMIDRPYHRLLRNEPYIDELLAPPPRIGRPGDAVAFTASLERLRRRRLSCVLDFHSNPRSALVTLLSGAPRRIGFDVRVRKIAYTEVEPRARWRNGRRLRMTSHEAALGLAERAGRVDAEPEPLCALTVDDETLAESLSLYDTLGIGAGAVGINPGKPYPAKAWPVDSFAGLARRLVSAGRRVVVLWGPGEREQAEWIRDRAGTGVLLAPELPLHLLAGFLKRLSLVMTIDSGLKHLAVSVRVPTVTLFGPTSRTEWHMGTAGDRAVSLDLSCSPCRLLECPFGSPCMTDIPVERVYAAVDSLLSGQDDAA